MDTKILSEEEKHIFHELLIKHDKEIGTRFDLLYRASETSDWKSRFTQEECLKQSVGKRGTITLIETESNNVFGVYTEYKWKKFQSSGDWYHDKNAFCFLIRSSAKHPPNIFEHNYNHNGKDEYTLQTFKGYICIFGMDGTIMIADGGKGIVSDGSSFTIPSGYHLNGGKHRFQTKEYEVWHCLKYES